MLHSESYYKTTIRKTIASCKWNFTSTRSCLDPVLSSIRAHNAQGITITNCDFTTWSWVNLVNPELTRQRTAGTVVLVVAKAYAVGKALHFLYLC